MLILRSICTAWFHFLFSVNIVQPLTVVSWLANLVSVTLTLRAFICRACEIMHCCAGLKGFFKRAWFNFQLKICYNTISIHGLSYELSIAVSDGCEVIESN